MPLAHERTYVDGVARTLAAFALGAALWLAPKAAAATESADDVDADRAARAQADRARVGVLAGVGFPHPLAIEAIAKFGRVAAIGVEYGAMPTVTIDGVNASLWSVAGDARVFPFGGAFYLGMRGGWQHLDGTATASVAAYGSATEALSYDSLFVNPRLGFLFVTRSGFSVGFDAGVQIPLQGTLTSSLPIGLLPPAQSLAGLAQGVLPTIDLLRIGMMM